MKPPKISLCVTQSPQKSVSLKINVLTEYFVRENEKMITQVISRNILIQTGTNHEESLGIRITI